MSDLIAQGPQSADRWRRPLPKLEPDATKMPEIVLGRSPGTWQVDWDDQISRQHVQLIVQQKDQIVVQRLPSGRNPVFYQGNKNDRFTLSRGDHFVIGRTTFTLADRPAVSNESSDPIGFTEHAFDPAALRRQRFYDVGHRMDVLGRLPNLIAGSSSDSELLVRVAAVMLQATPNAAAVAILAVHQNSTDSTRDMGVEVLHYDCRLPDTEGPRPSARLAKKAVQTNESMLHLWNGRSDNDGTASKTVYTAHNDIDWAFCIPIPSETNPNWALYVTGQQGLHQEEASDPALGGTPKPLLDDIKFTELVGATLGTLRQVRSLQRRQAGLRRFFAPVVMDALATRDADAALEPREANVSVLFCDLRGFSRRSEEASDQLMDLLNRVSEALGVITRQILQRDGVVGDFHGDAAMGFWGWPLEQADAAGRACQAALASSAEFVQAARMANRPMSGFRCGIGIATGRAVAGRIGTADQVKVTAFGPVVNLASRLESMTRALAAEVLIDEATANFVRTGLSPEVARVRRLIRVRPAGLQQPVDVSQLLPPQGEHSSLSDNDLINYEAALDALIEGHWEDAFTHLHEVSASDRAKDFLVATIARHGRVAPKNWDGVIDLPKS